MWQTYYTPTSIEETLRLLAEHGPDARLIAGGTDLLVEMQQGVRRVPTLIDVTRIGNLDQVRLDEDDVVHIGPTVTHNQAVSSELLVERALPLAMASWRVGTPQLRNRGTIVGNLVTASPANDSVTALGALDARIELASAQGQRVMGIEDFCRGVHHTAIADDEMVTGISFPALLPHQRGTFAKLALRRAHAISIVNVAVVLALDGDVVSDARIALGSVAPTVIRAREAEGALLGAPLRKERIDEAAYLAAQATRPIDDLRAGSDYRRDIVRTLVARSLSTLADGAEQPEFATAPVKLWGKTNGRFARVAGKTICHHSGGTEPIELSVNGRNVSVEGAGGKTLLHMLRDDLGLTGTKEGCGEGECGACTVWLDGIAVLACLVPAPRAHGTNVTTVEGLSSDDDLHPLQRTFIEEGAVQCGFCTPGFLMAGANLLEEVSQPTDAQVVQGLTGNLCRCTGYYRIVRAVEKAAIGSCAETDAAPKEPSAATPGRAA
jgi:xanthine dehydrogenase iron-sulfur cluster and FAD-binding subunit A